MNSSEKTVVVVRKTNGLEFDDRIRKISLSLLDKGFNVDILSFDVNSNTEESSHPYDSRINNTSYRLLTAKWFRGIKAFHMAEFGLRCFFTLISRRSRQQCVWLNDPIMVLIMPIFLLLRGMGVIKGIIWDQHELPLEAITRNGFFRKVFGKFIDWVDVTIEANHPRLEYIKDVYQVLKHKKAFVLRNFCHRTFALSDKGTLPQSFGVKEKEYFLLQSGGTHYRHFNSVVEAVMSLDKCLPLVVLGRTDPKMVEDARCRYGSEFDKRFIFTGMIPQLEIVNFLDNSLASIILYKKSISTNNWLCDPNRLFQAVNRGVPVIIGNNPPMIEIVEQYPYALVLDDDGSDSKHLAQVIEQSMDGRFAAVDKQAPRFLWESQEDDIKELVNIVFDS